MGCVARQVRHAAFVRDPRAAIYYAQNGFPLAERNERYWLAKSLMQQPGYKETYLPNGAAPKVDDEFKNPALANSLRQDSTRADYKVNYGMK
jgi:gamma-glutamyltranspeptidase